MVASFDLCCVVRVVHVGRVGVRMCECVCAGLQHGRRVCVPPHAPPLAYTLILFDRVVTPAPPGRPEMKSSPPAKPPRWGAVQRGPLGGGDAAVPEVPGSVLRARRSEVMN